MVSAKALPQPAAFPTPPQPLCTYAALNSGLRSPINSLLSSAARCRVSAFARPGYFTGAAPASAPAPANAAAPPLPAVAVAGRSRFMIVSSVAQKSRGTSAPLAAKHSLKPAGVVCPSAKLMMNSASVLSPMPRWLSSSGGVARKLAGLGARRTVQHTSCDFVD